MPDTNSAERSLLHAKRVPLSVVMPVYNEARTLREIVAAVLAVPMEKEVLLVDDHSSDNTPELLRELAKQHPEIRVIYKTRNAGKGAALRDGFAAARGEWIVVQDADLEYDPAEIPRLLEPLQAGIADVVYGSRFLARDGIHSPWLQRMGNWGLTQFSNLCTGLRLTDMETCHKAFRAEVLRGIQLKQNRFGFEPEITAKIARRRLRVLEIPITFRARSYADGKKIGMWDLLNALWCIVRYRVSD
jgi:glycosyltransferase involved in cell wall biosynthesis